MNPRLLFPITAVATALALVGSAPALAQTSAPGAPSSAPAAQPSAPTYTLIHVNPRAGSDTSGDGSQLRPYQTISYALTVATSNAIVLLAAGEYSEASGERFPIQLKAGVTVQGAPGTGLGQTVIRGSGVFPSTTAGLIHTTLIGVDGAGLGNVTVTNTSTAGYGLVIESGRPVIRQNSFSGSGYGGVYVAGQSAPVIEGNQFIQNGVVGLAIAGQATAEVRSNRFEQTGIGIRVAPGAQPHILNNTIVQNQEGILLDGSAQPRLENNVIAQNRRNGVVEFQTAAKADETVVVASTAIAAPAALRPIALTPATFGVEGETGAASSSPPPTLVNANWPSALAPTAMTSVDVIPPPPSRPRAASTPVAPDLAAIPGVEASSVSAQALPIAVPAQPATPDVAVSPNPSPPEQPMQVAPSTEPQLRPQPEAPSTSLTVEPPGSSLDPGSTLAVVPETLPEPEAAPEEPLGETVDSSATTPLADPTVAAIPTIPIAATAPISSQPPVAVAPAHQALPTESTPDVSNHPEPTPAPTSPNQATPAPTATSTATTHEGAIAIHERLRRIRQAATSSQSTPSASSSPSAPNPTENVAIPLQVVPPPAAALARANPTAIAAPSQSVPAAPTRPAPSTSAGEVSPLRVPGGNIPLGSGGSTIPNLSPPSTEIAFSSGQTPPPPPSHASMLGLVYKVFVPAADPSTQARVRAVVSDAFRVNINGQIMMQAGAYADQAPANARAAELLEQGLEARVEYIP